MGKKAYSQNKIIARNAQGPLWRKLLDFTNVMLKETWLSRDSVSEWEDSIALMPEI